MGMKMNENLLVIGLGSMGQRRVRILKQLYPHCTVAGIDSNPARAEKVGLEYGIEVYGDVEEITMPVYAAFICTSPESHHKLIHLCLEKGSHVFSEINLVDTGYEKNMALADARKRVLFLSSTPLYKDEIRYIIHKVRTNKEKKVYAYHVGQYLPDWHPWDNLRDFFVSEKSTNGCREILAIELPWLVAAFGKVQSVKVLKNNFSHLDIRFPDTYMIWLTHEDGTTGNLIVDVVSRKAVRKLEIYNEDMYLSWNGTPDSLLERDVEKGREHMIEFDNYIHDERYGAFINEAAYVREVEEFFEVLKGKKALYGFAQDQEIIDLINRIEG